MGKVRRDWPPPMPSKGAVPVQSGELRKSAGELKTPAEWCDLFNVEILALDGRRGSNGRPWTDRITVVEFNARLVKDEGGYIGILFSPTWVRHRPIRPIRWHWRRKDATK